MDPWVHEQFQHLAVADVVGAAGRALGALGVAVDDVAVAAAAPRRVGGLPPAGGEAAGRAGVDALVDRGAEDGPAARGGVARAADRRVRRLRHQGVGLGVGGQGRAGDRGADEQPAPRHPAAAGEPVDRAAPARWVARRRRPGRRRGRFLVVLTRSPPGRASSRPARSASERATAAARGTVAIRREWLPSTVNRQNARPPALKKCWLALRPTMSRGIRCGPNCDGRQARHALLLEQARCRRGRSRTRRARRRRPRGPGPRRPRSRSRRPWRVAGGSTRAAPAGCAR